MSSLLLALYKDFSIFSNSSCGTDLPSFPLVPFGPEGPTGPIGPRSPFGPTVPIGKEAQPAKINTNAREIFFII